MEKQTVGLIQGWGFARQIQWKVSGTGKRRILFKVEVEVTAMASKLGGEDVKVGGATGKLDRG